MTTRLRIFLTIIMTAIVVFCVFLIKDTYFTSDFDRWFNKAYSAYNSHPFELFPNPACPEARSYLSKALASWKASDTLEKKLNALYWQADLLKAELKYSEAISSYSQAIAIDPKAFQLYLARGKCLGLSDAAIADFTKGLELTGYPRTIEYIHSKHDFIPPKYADELYYLRGKAYFEKRDFPKAISDFTDVIRNMQDPQTMKQVPWAGYSAWVGEAYHLRGKAYNRTQQYEKAIQDFSTCIAFAHFENFSDTDRERGYAYLQTRQYEKAIDDFTEANKSEMDAANQWFNYHERALAYKMLGQMGQASPDEAEAAKRYPMWILGSGNSDTKDLVRD